MPEIVPIQKQIDDLRTMLGRHYKQMTALLPKHITPERMARVAIDCAIRTPQLAQCTHQSFMGCLLEAAALGLEPGIAGQCWPVPFKDKSGNYIATLIMGYRGVAQLALRSRRVSAIWAQAVRANDRFEYTDYPQDMKHKRNRSADVEQKNNELVAAYSVIRNDFGHEHFLVLERDEILKIKVSSRAASSPNSAWTLWEEQMWLKCPIKRHVKLAPMSITDHALYRAVQLDDLAERGLPQELEITHADEIVVTEEEQQNENKTPKGE